MSSVELRSQIHCQPKLSECVTDHGRVGRRGHEIAAQANEDLGVAAHHRFQRVNYVMSMLPRWLEAEHRVQAVQEFAAGPLRDAYGAITLNV